MHRVAEVVVGIRRPAAVGADILGVQDHLLYGLEFLLRRQCTDVLRVIAFARLIRHGSSLYIIIFFISGIKIFKYFFFMPPKRIFMWPEGRITRSANCLTVEIQNRKFI